MAKGEAVTFFQSGLPAIEWDAKKDAPKYEFEKRFLTTTDTKLQKMLDDRGYKRWTPADVPKGWTKDGNVEGASVSVLPKKPKDDEPDSSGDNGDNGKEKEDDDDTDGNERFTAGE